MGEGAGEAPAPVNHLDQDGRILDTIWDIYSVASGIYSAAKNTIKGEFKEALKDAAGVGLDVVSAVIPGVPAVGRVLRNGDNLVDIAKGADRIDDVVDAGKFIDKSGVPQNITKNLRNNLKKATGLDPKDMDAHHILPQKFNIQFEKAKININDPKYGIWLEKKSHSKKSYEYNQKWEGFFKGFEKNNSEPTAEEILTFMKQVMKETFDIDI